MASRYNLLSPNDSELLPEEKLAQIANYFSGRRPQSEEELQGFIPEQPTGNTQQAGSSIALGGPTPEQGAQDAQDANDQNQAIIEYIKQQRQLAEPYLRKSEQGINEYEQKVKDFENAPQGVNVRPVLNWLDSNYGTKLAQGYEAPLSQEEKLQKIAAMYQGLQGSREKAIQDALSLGNNKLMGQALLQQGRKATSDKHAEARIGQQETNTIDSIVKSIHTNPNITKYSQLISQATTDHNTLKKAIDNKDILPNQLFDELQLGLARLVNGPGAIPESRAESVQFNSWQQEWGKKLQKMTGKLQGPVPEEFKQQLLHSFERLQKEWENRRYETAKTLSKGRPTDRIKGSEKYINEAVNSYMPGSENAHGLVRPGQVDASDWAKATEEEKQALVNHFK